MAEEVLRLGVNPRDGVRGMNQFRRSAGATQLSAQQLAASIGVLGGAMVAFAGARQVGTAIKGLISFDAAMTESLAIMGDVSVAMRQDMVEAAREVGEELNFAAEQGAEAFFFLASAGLDAEQSVAALPAVAEFARAGMFDFATATDLATDAQSALGLASDDAAENLRNMTRVTDVLVGANTLANASVEQFAESLTNRSAAALRNANREVEEGVAVLAAYADQGTKGTRAGEMLSRMMRILAQGAKENREEFERLGLIDTAGNLTSLADVVEIMTRELEGLSDVQRTARLEQLGFMAEAQEAINPLLGTADAIRENEERLRELGGITGEVADNQMQSLENRIGQIQQEFANWQTEMAEDTVPAIEFLIENVDVAVDSFRALVIVVGAAGAVAAFSALAPAIIGTTTAFLALVPAVNSLSAGLALLQIAIGPAGWVVAGLSAATGALTIFMRQSREMREEVERQEEALREAADAMGTFDEAATRATLSNLGQAASRITADIQRLKAEIAEAPGPTGRGTGGTERAALQAQLREQQQRLAELDPLIAAAGQRWTELGDEAEAAADAVGGVETAAAGVAGSLDDEIDLLSRAVELGVAQAEQFERLLEIQSEQRDILDDQTSSLGEQVVAAERRLEAERAIDRFISNRTTAGREIGAPGTTSLTGGSIVAPEVQRLIEDTGNLEAALQGAGAETDNWAESIDPAVRGIIAVADGFGLIEGRARDAVRGLSDIAGGISSLQGAAGQAGGFGEALSTAGGIASLLPGAGQIIGGIAGLVGGLLGGGPSEEELEQIRLAEERNRILEQNRDAVIAMRDRLGPTIEELLQGTFTGNEVLGRTEPFDASQLEQFFRDPAQFSDLDIPDIGLPTPEEIERLADAFGIDLENSVGQILPEAFKQLEDAIALALEEIQRAQDTFNDELEVRRLLAQGMDEEAAARRRMLEDQAEIQRALEQGFDEATIAALREVQALEEEARAKREATRAAEEAARQERERAATLSDFAAREAALGGDDVEALRIRREAAAAQELAALEELVEAGTITADEFERFAEVLDGEVAQAVEDATTAQEEAARAAREAAEAERFRAMVDMENLRVRNLVARGMDREAEALRAQLEIMNAVNDGRSEEYIALLRQTLAIEQQNDAERDRQRAIEETTRLIDGQTRMLNGPAGYSVALRQAQTLGVGSPVFGVQTPNFQQPIQGGSGDINIQSVTIQAAPGDSGADLWAKFQEEARRQARATGSNPFDGIGEG